MLVLAIQLSTHTHPDSSLGPNSQQGPHPKARAPQGLFAENEAEKTRPPTPHPRETEICHRGPGRHGRLVHAPTNEPTATTPWRDRPGNYKAP
jgi:hypothetical protein